LKTKNIIKFFFFFFTSLIKYQIINVDIFLINLTFSSNEFKIIKLKFLFFILLIKLLKINFIIVKSL
jgi:hypothetical protein